LKKWLKVALLLSLAALLVGAAAVWAVYRFYIKGRDDAYWSTQSATARAELDAGLKDLVRDYYPDAAGHFERVLELDSKNAAARVLLSWVYHGTEADRAKLLEGLNAIDLAGLTDFEVFLIGLGKAERRTAEVKALVDDYLEDHPNEAFARSIRCDIYWDALQWPQAEDCYRELLRIHPDWVSAQRRLGDLAMAQGRFREAEDHYLTYRYIAPDQGGPYYALGQLYLFLGRYEESEEVQRKGVALKPDFCQAYQGLLHLYIFWDRPEQVATILDQVAQQPACRYLETWGVSCARRAFLDYLRGDFDAAFAKDQACPRRARYDLIGHHLAVLAGDRERALRLETTLAEQIATAGEPANPFPSGYLHHYRGVRLFGEGDYAQACSELALADKEMGYWAGEMAFLVLLNRVYQVACLEAAGDAAATERVRGEISAVNPRLLAFRLPELRPEFRARLRAPGGR
jgi:tetratricopeptide (TPR) repeat protein